MITLKIWWVPIISGNRVNSTFGKRKMGDLNYSYVSNERTCTLIYSNFLNKYFEDSSLGKKYCNLFLFFKNFHFYFVSDSSEVTNLLFFHTFLLKSSFFSVFDHISPQYVWITSQIWYYNFVFRISSGFFPDFSGFS